ncbi:MAG: hypothetical protein ACTSRB_14730 [Candidatus Helarchaeota archaeon]
MVEVKEERSENVMLNLSDRERECLATFPRLEITVRRSFSTGAYEHQIIEMHGVLPGFLDPLPYYLVLDKVILQMREKTVCDKIILERDTKFNELMDDLETIKQNIQNYLARTDYISQQIREYLEGKKDD